MAEKPDGWHYNARGEIHEFWWGDKLVHKVTDEAYDAFRAYLKTPSGRRWALTMLWESILDA